MAVILFQEIIIRLRAIQFTPKWIPTIATIIVMLITANLGRWQLNRADEKRTLQQQYELMQAQPKVTLRGDEGNNLSYLQFGKIEVQGHFNSRHQIFLDNQVEDTSAGYHVLTPLLLLDGKHYILVNRGWISRSPSYPKPPKIDAPAGEVTITGYGLMPAKRFFELSSDTIQDSVWQNLTFDRYKRQTGLNVLPLILVQTENNSKGLIPVRQKPQFGIEKHEGYAFQWFSMAACVVLFYLFFNVRLIKESS